MEQVLTSFNMEGYDSWPSGVPTTVCAQSTTMQEKLADRILINHLKRFKYACYTGDEPPNPPDNSISDYGCNLCHWALHLLHLNDMAKEGDFARTSLSLKANIPFFYGHSKLSKYFVECLDLLLKTEVTCSPRMQLRILEGSFTNKHGGVGANVETDLIMEHSIRNRKDLIKGLGANKTEKAIQRVTMAADTVVDVCKSFNTALKVQTRSGKHSTIIQTADEQKVKDTLRQLQPFQWQAGRDNCSFNIPASPFTRVNMDDLKVDIANVLQRLTRGIHTVETDEDPADPADTIPDDVDCDTLPEI